MKFLIQLSVLAACLLSGKTMAQDTNALNSNAPLSSERADCSETLSDDHNRDAFSWHIDHDRIDHEIKDPGVALAVVRLIAFDSGCDPKSVDFEVSAKKSASCQQLIPGNSISHACFVETNVGYFMVSETLPNGIAVTWSRWD